MPFEDVTLEQLRAATKEQIITVLTNRLNNLTKRQLIILILKLQGADIDFHVTTETIAQETGPNGQILKRYLVKDVLGTVTAKINVDWTYYPEGPVDEIITETFDPLDVLISRKTIKHYRDGRQPTVTETP